MNDSNPYVGPRALLEEDKIFGRNIETQRLLNLLIANRIVLLHSPSGAGKSSLINAGLVPLLAKRGFTVLGPLRVNLEPPLDVVDVDNCNRYTWSILQELEEHMPEDQRSDPADLICTTIEDYLKHYRQANPAAGRLVLIFDQFEEILTIDPLDRTQQRKNFFIQLGAALFDSSIWALFTAREDFIAALDPYLSYIPTRLQNNFRLDFLSKDAAREAIQGPLKALDLGISYTPAAVDKLVKDLASIQVKLPSGEVIEDDGSYVEPVQLQVACRHLFNHLEPGITEITEQMVEGVTDVDTSLSVYYKEQVDRISEEAGVHVRQIRDFFQEELITPQHIRGLVQEGASKRLKDGVIRRLVNAYLVRSEKRLNSTWYELAHDRLIQPILNDNKAWRKENLNLLQRQAQVWVSEKNNNNLLLRGEELDRWQQWAADNPGDVTDPERQFLEKSEEREVLRQERAERERIEQELKLEKARELAEAEKRRAEQQTRSAKQLRVAFAIAILLFGAAVLLGLRSFSQQKVAVAARITADISAALAQTAEVDAKEQRTTAEFSSEMAVTQAAIAQAQATQAYEQKLVAETQKIAALQAQAVAETAQAEALVAKSEAEDRRAEAELLRLQAERQLITRSQGLAQAAEAIMPAHYELSLLLAVEANKIADTVQARDALIDGIQFKLSRGQQEFRSFNRDFTESPITFSQDGRYLGWGEPLGHVVIYDTRNMEEIDFRGVHDSNVRSLALCSLPGNLLIASGGRDLSLNLWSLADDTIRTVDHLPARINSLSFTSDCSKLAASSGTIVEFYDVASDGSGAVRTENLRARLENHIINKIQWSPDGRSLYSANVGGQIHVYDPLRGEKKLFRSFPRESALIFLHPDGEHLFVSFKLGQVELWNLRTGERVRTYERLVPRPGSQPGQDMIRIGPNTSGAMGLSPDGLLFAVPGDSDTILVFNSLTGDLVATLRSGISGSPATALYFGGADGRVLLASTTNFNLQVTELFVNQSISETVQHQSPAAAIAVDPSGRLLAAHFDGRTVEVYQGDTGQPVFSYQAGGDITHLALMPDSSELVIVLSGGKIETVRITRAAAARSAPILPFTGAAEGDQASRSVAAVAMRPPGQAAPTAYVLPSAAVAFCEINTTRQGEECAQVTVEVYGSLSAAPLQVYRYGPAPAPISLAIDPSGRYLAAANPLRVWDMLGKDDQPIQVDNSLVMQMAFEPSARYLAIAASNREIVWLDLASLNWDIGSGARARYYGPLRGFSGLVESMAYTADGSLLYTLDGSRRLMRWTVDRETWINLACRAAGRNMTSQEWEEYFPGQEFHETCPEYAAAAP